MIVFSIPASWVFEKIGWYKTVSIAGIVLMVFTLLRGFIGGSSYTALVITTPASPSHSPSSSMPSA